jgi:hypothetical protein
MAKLPEMPPDSPTVAAIYAAYVAKQEKRRSRRLGASVLGKPCARAVWYDFRWCGSEQFDGRMTRLFETGHVEELRFIQNLRDIGAEVSDVDPATGQQHEFTAVGGHVVCKIDAAVVGLPESPKAWHAAEFKTHNNKSFSEVAKKGLREAKPQHWVQLLVGMALSGMERGLYLAANKDTDALYAERVRWEEVKDSAAGVLDFAAKIVAAAEPPGRISDDADYYLCRFCCHKDRCHGSVVADVTCRSCVHATPVIEDGGSGRWTCAKHGGKTLAVAEQERACDDHLFIPPLVPFAEPQDAGADPTGDWIEYRTPDGRMWRNGHQKGQYRSVELAQLPPEQVGVGLVDGIKSSMGGIVIGFEPAMVEAGAS